MPKKKNYLRYYKRTYLKGQSARLRRRIFGFAGLMLFASAVVVACVFVKIESENEESQNEASLAMNRAVSVKKKRLRTDFSAWNRSCDWPLIVVNDINEMPAYYRPRLKQIGDVEVDERIMPALSEMLREASKSGVKLWISLGYRSKERQERLFNAEVEKFLQSGMAKDQARELALKNVSAPGHNEHNTGLAVDFNAAVEEFLTTPEYQWLRDNCEKFGFIARYEKEKEAVTGRAAEPAHFRYVGEEHAVAMKAKNLCLEEYVSGLIR